MVLNHQIAGFLTECKHRDIFMPRQYSSNNLTSCCFLYFFPKEVIKVKVEEVDDSGSQSFIINKDVTSVQRIGLC